jgi:hypothetical protein
MAYRSGTTPATGTTTALDPGKPTGWAAGDLLVAIVAGRINTYAITPPAGWTQIYAESTGRQYVYVAAGSVSSTSFSRDGVDGGTSMGVQIYAFSGLAVSASQPTATNNALVDDSGHTVHTCPAVTAAAGDDLLLIWMQVTSSTNFGATPGDTTQRDNVTDSSLFNFAVSTKEGVSAGSTGTFSRTTAALEYNYVWTTTIALAAGGGGSGTATTAWLKA